MLHMSHIQTNLGGPFICINFSCDYSQLYNYNLSNFETAKNEFEFFMVSRKKYESLGTISYLDKT